MKILSIIFFLGISIAAHAGTQQRQLYKKALDAINKGDLITFESLAPSLKGYVLYPYVEYHRLRVKLANVSKSKIDAFFTKYQGQPIANHLKSKWVKHLLNKSRFAEASSYSAPNHATTLRCNILFAKLKSGIDIQYLPNKDLWLYGKSRPDACNPVFEYWKSKGYIGQVAYGKRAKLAVGENNLKFAQKLALKSDAASKNLIAAHVRKKQAISRAKSFAAGSYATLAALPSSVVDDKVREWKARQFIHSGSWDRLKKEIEKMPAKQQAEDIWQYWLARAYARLGNKNQARSLYRQAAKNSSFYGFLSADRLGENYSICKKNKSINLKQFYQKFPEIERAFELRHVGSDYFAGMEWTHAIRRMQNADIIKASLLAGRQGWYLKSILALGKIREFQYYDARFPLLYKNSIMRYSKARGLDPAFTYGIARTESALRPDAVSPVGARGLMQLMPATARSVAKKYGSGTVTNAKLIQPDFNVSLGTGYLDQMSKRWNGQLILMIASYNAGPHRGAKWIKILPHEADRFIASIPFDETRKYVTRVLDYTTMYNWILGRPVKRIGGRISNIGSNKAFIGNKNATTQVVCKN